MLGPAKRLVTSGSRAAGRAVSELTLAVTEIPGADTVPVRRIGLSVSMLMDPRGSTLLEALGDDLDEQARTLDRFLSRCSDGEITELLAVFQEAASRRSQRREALSLNGTP